MEPEEKQDLLNIHQFAQICRTTPRTIRFYEENGLLFPITVDQFTKYRYYEAEQAKDFFRIKLIQRFGTPLKDIQNVVRSKNEKSYLNKKLEELRKEIEERKKKHLFLKSIKEFLYGKGEIKGKARFESFGAYTLLCTHSKNIRYDMLNEEIMKMRDLSRDLGIQCVDKQMVFYLLPNKYEPKGTELEICLILKDQRIPENINLPKSFYLRKYPKQKALTYTYKGPFEYLTFIHRKMYDLTKDKKLTSYPFDMHIYGPWNKSSEFDHITKVGYPIRE